MPGVGRIEEASGHRGQQRAGGCARWGGGFEGGRVGGGSGRARSYEGHELLKGVGHLLQGLPAWSANGMEGGHLWAGRC